MGTQGTGDATAEKIAEKKSREIQLIQFFIQCRVASSRVATPYNFHRALATRQNFKKNRITGASQKSLEVSEV